MSLAADTEEKAYKHNKRAGRLLAQELDAQRDMERMHLETIRKEKIRLQKELEKVRNKGQYLVGRKPPITKGTRLLQSRYASQSNIDPSQSLNIDSSDRHLTTSPVNRQSGLPRLQSGQVIEESALETEYRSRRNGYDQVVNKKQLNHQRQRVELEMEQNFLNARVEQFTRSLTPQTLHKSSQPEGKGVEKEEGQISYEEIITLNGDDGNKSMKSSSSIDSLKPKRKKSRQMTIADYDVNQAKTSVAKRLLSEGEDNRTTGGQGVVPSLVNNKKKLLRRRSTQIGLVNRDEVNKYAQLESQNSSSVSQGNVPDEEQTKDRKYKDKKEMNNRDSEVQLNLKGVGANTRRQVLQIIENPDLQFDDDRYAPDGELRTVHMLPDQEEAFEEARHARYLRWRNPKEMAKEKELSVGDIFAKDSSGRYIPDTVREDGQTVNA
ncbi:hypothetical protein BSL78_00998 [Apostichopus japonicus]|uniref:Uncharacterized protein n=1 Tax=Stichopus japonicus TaxID=307972 RepID=A0A2G8LP22_STIJA|nr:hypothetical protein BSL78_00998 [Apostichopus japonicus]